MRWRSVSLTACSVLAALAVAGCGGGDDGDADAQPPVEGPRIERMLADGLAERTDEVARRLQAQDSCGARAEADALRNELIAAINARKLPETYLEDLTAAVNELAEQVPACGQQAPADEEGDEREATPDSAVTRRAEVPRGETPRESARLLGGWLRARRD